MAPGKETSKVTRAGREVPKVSVLGSHYSVMARDAAHKVLLQAALAGESGYVCVSNVHTTMTGFFQPAYRRITNEASFTVPDGMPIVWAMRSLGCREQNRLHGPTLMRDLIDQGRALGARHYLYGGSPEAIRLLKEALLAKYPGVEIVGAESPPFRPFDQITDAEFAEAAARINAAAPHFVWVGLGAPKQEKWMHRQRHQVRGIMFGIGAAFDIIPGRVPEAPRWMQGAGLEWLYRLSREPRRLWSRYFFYNPAFLVLWAGQVVLRAFGADFRVVP
jgi:N-acetylglucosaminyldiphosphoundecaprenol N-acetyl-beta-D-mannosaminyltransferase